MRFSLIIFDCDGVLVDSEPITNRVFCRMLNELGLEITFDETMRTFMGRTMQGCVEIIEQRLGRPAPPDFIDDYYRRILPAFEGQLQPVTGVVDALDAITVPTCVASSGSHEKMRTTLGLTGLLSRFDGRLFSGTEVARGKPNPDLFLYAAREMGHAPDTCAVIEDSVAGVEAAVAAGMTVFGYAGYTPPDALEGAGAIVFDDMRSLPELLADDNASES
ncbi:HAD-IA family hydrolase [candidate division GN15 bacterium]|nr:HAD-IA family hydrolase [candidate division GN15 bacterium]